MHSHYHQPNYTAATVIKCLKKLPHLRTVTVMEPFWFIHHRSHTGACTHTKQKWMHAHPHSNRNTIADTLAQTWTITCCPIEFAGPVAKHNEVFTLRHSSSREWQGEGGGFSGCDMEKEGVRKEKRHSMIMYELSAVLHGGGKSAVVHLKRRLSCQDTVIPRWTLIFIGHWSLLSVWVWTQKEANQERRVCVGHAAESSHNRTK